MTTTEKRLLRYDFTASEVHDLSMKLANEIKNVSTLSEEKKSVTSQWTARINEAKAACNSLSFKVSDGYEHRNIECEVIFNQPSNGKKTIIRKDNNTLVAIEDMSKEDWDKINAEQSLFPLDENLLAEAEKQEA